MKLTNGWTSAVAVSEPALRWTEAIVPMGTPGTSGWSPTEAYVLTSCPGCSTVFASNKVSRSMAGPDMDLPVPVTDPISPLPASCTPSTDDASSASRTVEVSSLTCVMVPTKPEPLSTVSFGVIPSLRPTSSVTVSE